MATPIPENRATFTLADVLRETAGVVLPGSSLEEGSTVTGIFTDTRTSGAGSAFVALRGDNHDGHDHLAAAARAGARLAIVERDVAAPPGLAVVRVDSTLRALGCLARAHARSWRALGGRRVVIAITGSAGKTTTRVATTALLEHFYPAAVHGSSGNLNNRIGVPMVLLGLTPAHAVAVIELGMNRPGEIEALAQIAEPEIGVVTLVAAAHTELCGSVDGVAHEKGALFRALPASGVAIGNADDERVRKLLEASPAGKRYLYGRAADADLRIGDRRVSGLDSSEVWLEREGHGEISFRTPLLGEAGALACAAAVAIAWGALGEEVTSELAAESFARADVGAGAGRLVPRVFANGLAVIDDSYNSNPASACSSIATAAEIARATGRRLLLVLGEMRELGAESAAGHELVGRAAATSGADQVFAIGGEAARIAAEAAKGGVIGAFTNRVEEAAILMRLAARPGDLVLVKASRSVGAELVVQTLAGAYDTATGGDR